MTNAILAKHKDCFPLIDGYPGDRYSDKYSGPSIDEKPPFEIAERFLRQCQSLCQRISESRASLKEAADAAYDVEEVLRNGVAGALRKRLGLAVFEADLALQNAQSLESFLSNLEANVDSSTSFRNNQETLKNLA